MLNSQPEVSANAITDDSFSYAHTVKNGCSVRIWTLEQRNLLKLKSANELLEIDPNGENQMHQAFDCSEEPKYRDLVGHHGKVYSIVFSNCKYYIFTAGEDSTIRMWSLLTFTCLVQYKCGPANKFPVWCMDYAPYGRYFVSGGADHLVRIWATDDSKPLRILQGHDSDVNCVKFHPNSHYVVSGSEDRTVRLWEISTGQVRRIFNYYNQMQVMNLSFSPCGKYLASSDCSKDKIVVVWDIELSVVKQRFIVDPSTDNFIEKSNKPGSVNNYLPGKAGQTKSFITSLCFSREIDECLACTTSDGKVRVWMYKPGANTDEMLNEGALLHPYSKEDDIRHILKNSQVNLMASVQSKCVPLSLVHFTRRNLMLTFGAVTKKTLIDNLN